MFSSLHWVPVCQNVFLIPLVGLDIPCTVGKRKNSGHILYTKLVSSSGCNLESYILNYSRLFRQNFFLNVVLVSGKQMSSTPLSHSKLIFTTCHIKAETHSYTVGIQAPTGDFGQE